MHRHRPESGRTNGDRGERERRYFPIVADMTIREEVQRAVDETLEGLGRIDACVDIIGGARWDKAEDFSVEDWQWTMLNNVTQVFYLFQVVSHQMIAQGTGGSMVALASVDGIAAAAMHAPYGAAKAGVISLAESFAQELGRHGIRVNAVAPGNVGTGNEDWPEGRWAVDAVNPLAPPRARDIGNAVLFLFRLGCPHHRADPRGGRRRHHPRVVGDDRGGASPLPVGRLPGPAGLTPDTPTGAWPG
jgi:3-oxoacyl-[acyl-carrier protein] reductase